MSRMFTRDFLIEVQKGNVPGHRMVHKYGRNPSVPNGSFGHISAIPFATTNFRQSAATMRVKSGGNAADTAAGAGAREVTIQGIDSAFAETSEAVATAGASASSATSASFWRVHRAWVSGAGAYTSSNTDDIIIEDSAGTADLIQITASEGQTQYAGYTVPVGETAYLVSVFATVDGAKAADIRMVTRETIDDIVAPMPAARLKLYFDGVSTPFTYRPLGPELSIPEKSDIWFEGQGVGVGVEVSVNFELLIVEN